MTKYVLKNTDGSGLYLVGDLSYLFEHEEWLQLLDKGFRTDESGIYHHREHQVFLCSTGTDGYHHLYEDGEQKDTVPVDTASIGLMPWDLASETVGFEWNDDLSEEENFELQEKLLMTHHYVYESEEDIEIEVKEDFIIIDQSLYILRIHGQLKEFDGTLRFD
jgi:hypothetical protein